MQEFPMIGQTTMVRSGSGQLVRGQTHFGAKPQARRFLLCLLYWEGDKEATEDLAELIADLERIRNREVDVLIFARADAGPFSQLARTRLESKFNKVMFERCRRKDAKGYPWGANAMWSDLLMLMAQYAPYKDDYFAFINLESDCCPLHPGWIGDLVRAYWAATEEEKFAVGYIFRGTGGPVEHLNGVAVYAQDIYSRVGSGKLSGGNPRVGYDTHHAKALMPFATSTPFIRLDFQRPTITADELFQEQMGVEPAMFHGVKDGSAREAVRARHVTLTDVKDVAKKTVFTFYVKTPNTSADDAQRNLALWRDGWRSRGWNPIVLGLRDATRNPNFQRLKDAVDRLPTTREREMATSRFIRWLALENFGGGLMVDSDILPGRFTPGDVEKRDALVLTKPDIRDINAAVFDKPNLSRFIEAVIGYDARPEDIIDNKPDVTDFTVWRTMENAPIKPTVAEYGETGYQQAKLVHFGAEAVMRVTKGEKQAVAMERFLRGN